MEVPVKVFDHAKDLPLPKYMTDGSAGMDLYAACLQSVTLNFGERAIIPSGIAIALPKGYQAQIRSRSGLALKNGVIVMNAPGTIDSDYRGEIGIILCSFGKEPFIVERGARIAQIVISQYTTIKWKPVLNLDDTSRRDQGFGSTGV
ncbi:MAG: dUTP diphosphatase [Holosporales bacterium]|jgi:dUTP pyrophosphatase|nr:dUTP diphosphatase [Holosporales bacterium]